MLTMTSMWLKYSNMCQHCHERYYCIFKDNIVLCIHCSRRLLFADEIYMDYCLNSLLLPGFRIFFFGREREIIFNIEGIFFCLRYKKMSIKKRE